MEEVLELKNISKSFKKKEILSEINLKINKNEILGIIGHSASGKSVLIKILIGFYKPTKGKIIFNQINNGSLGFSMQHNSLYPEMTVKQNLKYFSKIYKVKKKSYIKRIPFLINLLKLNEFQKTPVKNLSGGTKKRVDIACGLLNDPEIFILDEPFLGLDPPLVELLSQIILYLKENGKTIIISSHRTKELSKISDRIALVKEKKIQIINKNEIIQSY